MHKGSVLMRRVRCQDTTDHLQTCIAQSLQTTTSHPRVGIRERHDNPLDPSGQNCLGARRRPAVMTTGLESDNDRASARHRTGLRKSSWLSMRLPGPCMKPLSHQAAGCIQHNSPHQRVRAGTPAPRAASCSARRIQGIQRCSGMAKSGISSTAQIAHHATQPPHKEERASH